MPIAPRKLPSQAIIATYLSYDPETGVVTKNHVPRSCFRSDAAYVASVARDAGKVVGTKNNRGYLFAMIGGVTYPLHRLIWALVNGSVPEGLYIDHINGVRDDNRICNLRLATWSQNTQNAGTRKDNALGHKGIRVLPSGRFGVRAKVNGEQKPLGAYDTLEEAIAVRDQWGRLNRGSFHRNTDTNQTNKPKTK